MDKHLKIGLLLGGVCSVASLSYWCSQYQTHLPQFDRPAPTLTVTQKRRRMNDPYYKKIREAEDKVGCKFYLILDTKNKEAHGLLNEEAVSDSLIQNLSEDIDKDEKTTGTNMELNINNMKKKCTRYDKKLRLILSKAKEASGKNQFQVRTNDQGPDYKAID